MVHRPGHHLGPPPSPAPRVTRHPTVPTRPAPPAERGTLRPPEHHRGTPARPNPTINQTKDQHNGRSRRCGSG
jgi:hypothetical protein